MKVSVIIPVKNGEATIHACLCSIYSQTISNEIEVIILDSASTDNTLAICETFSVQVVHIKPQHFNHGSTRNYGISLAKGKLIYLTVQDARIAEPDMLERMIHHFEDSAVAGVVGMQAVPNDKDKNPAVWFKRFSEPQVETKYYPNSTFLELSPEEQFQNSAWDNVNAMYRRAALEVIPFKMTNFSEDWLWANDALKKGFKLIRDPSCVTYHYHHRNFSYTFRTDFIVNYYFFKYFNVVPSFPNSFALLMRAWYRILKKRNNFSRLEVIYWFNHNLASITAHTLSHAIFILICFFNKQKALDDVYQIFCKQVPQGKQKLK